MIQQLSPEEVKLLETVVSQESGGFLSSLPFIGSREPGYAWDPENPDRTGQTLIDDGYARVLTVLDPCQMLEVSFELLPFAEHSPATEDALNSIASAHYLKLTKKGRKYLEKG